MNTSNNNLLEFLKEKYTEVYQFVYKHLRIVLPTALAVIAIIVFAIAMSAHSKKVAQQQAEETVVESQMDPDTVVIGVPEIALEEDAYPALNELIKKYYIAMANGDIDTIKSINNNVDETETIRIEETSKYVESYQDVKVYSKVGPTEGTYLAYVYSKLKFSDYDEAVPGMKAYYVCTDSDGNLYINDGEETDSVTNYIREASLQADVKELNNTVAVAYNDMVADNEELMVFLVDLTNTIDTAVGETLAQNEGSVEVADASEETQEEPEEEEQTTETIIKVKPTTTVNVRSSDSETADKLGKATEGEEFTLLEERGNGWSKIDYNGKEAFIKTEFLAESSKEVKAVENDTEKAETGDNTATASDKTTDTKKEEKTTTDSGSTKVVGKVMVKDNVRVRKTASEDGEKITTMYMGQTLDYIEKLSNGWTKVKYNGQIGYVKSEYVEVQ